LEWQYGDYAAWQREWLQGEVLEEQLRYWRRQLGGALPVLELPTDRPRPAVQSYRGSQRGFRLNDELTAAVKLLSRRAGVTLFMTLLAGFQVLLYRYSQQDDILVGTVIAGRTHKETEPLLGCFVNTLVLRTDLSGNPKFSQLLGRVREVSLSAYAHQEAPFEKLVEELQPERSLRHTPLFQVAFGVQNTPPLALELAGLKLSTVGAPPEVGRFELTVWVVETSEGMRVRWSYNTDLFDDRRIERMQSHYEMLLQSIVADPEQRINSLNSLTDAERAQQAAELDVQEEASLMTLMNARRRLQANAQYD
jgi:non-ribosomal peptide synthetase component F